ncbi:hypothetical protein EDD37DRAFT_450051 [Exophiala viscosa]|uniref:uncharacterized protein n=1 Tax=Exophiala viscosa TaxID=2486360 RepID=UPI0021A04A0D|nr:hypothetical protein EDD37DRAFT_450051 [Exophiala viscosa]
MTDSCEHKRTIGCALTALPGCCACADKRPLATAYPVYIDGQGMKLQGKRWARYCWKCRDYWNLRSEAVPNLSLPVNPELVQAMRPLPRSATSVRESMPFHQSLQSGRQNTSWSFDGVADLRQNAGHELNPTEPQHPTSIRSNPISDPSRTRRVLPLDLTVPQIHSGITPATTTDQHGTTSRRRHRQHPNPFGTREEIESADYSSPVADLFGRAWNRYREVQEGNRARRTEEEERRRNGDVSLLGTAPPQDNEVDLHSEMAYQLAQATVSRERIRLIAMEETLRQRDILQQTPRVNPIDHQTSRPPPLTAEEMRLDMACKICCEQKVDTLLEPCMHLAICHWCSEIVRQRAHQRRRERIEAMATTGDDRHKWRCPICRRDVMQSRRVFLA